MRYINKILFLLLIPFCLFSNEKNETYLFGLESKSFVRTNYSDAKVALSLLMKELGGEEDVNIDIKYYKNQYDIIRDFKNKKLYIIIKDVVSYLKNHETIDKNSVFLWTLSTHKKSNFYSNLLVVKKESKIQSLKNIEGKVIRIKGNDSLARLWLYKKLAKPYNLLIDDELKVTKLSNTVLNILFNKSDIEIVSGDTWNTMTKLNPSLLKQLKILIQSKPIFIPIIGATKKQNTSIDRRNRLFDKFVKTANRVEEGIHLKQIRTLIKFENVYILKKNDLKDLFELYSEYLRFKGK